MEVLNARPEGRSALILGAITISLAVHVFIFGVIYLLTVAPAIDQAEVEETVDEIELAFEEPEMVDQQMIDESNLSEEVKNLLAAAGSERSSSQMNYNGMTQAEIKAMVEQNLRNEEKGEFDKLATNHKDFSVNEKTPDPNKGKDDKSTKKDDTSWWKEQNKKSYSGPVSAEFNLAGRNPTNTPRPTYRCKTAGKVIVNIEVNSAGQVTNAWVDERSSNIDCIRQESLEYAKKWKFNYDEKAAKKQSGTITFTFSNQ